MDMKQTMESVRNGGFFQNWMPNLQRLALVHALKGEEKLFFVELLTGMRERVENMPKTYEQDGLGGDAVAHLHYFIGSIDAWITEKDMGAGDGDDRQHQAFGKVCLNGVKKDAELGYISIQELIESGVELDLYWTPKKLKEI